MTKPKAAKRPSRVVKVKPARPKARAPLQRTSRCTSLRGRRLDALIVRTVPGVRKAVK